jgi:acyl-CoA thioesterase FadM
MQVYIEDTDAYGVLYNANYLRAYERALHLASVSASSGEDQHLPPLGGGTLQHSDWFVLGVSEHKFRGSPPLGGEFFVSGQLIERECSDDDNGVSGDGCIETWRLELSKSPHGNENTTIYNTAVLTIASPTTDGGIPPQFHPLSPPFDRKSSGATVRSSFKPFRDEFDPNLPFRMPLRNVLNLFERARSDYLGGPDELRRMEVEDGIVWVVTAVDSCELCNIGEAGWESGDGDDSSQFVQCSPFQDVSVKTNFVAKRGGMVLVCDQTLLVPVRDEILGREKNRRLAQAQISIMALDARTRRPTRKIPKWFVDKINGF